ncbi:MAG: hypothetical protein KA154_09275 [Gemmatimonadaceae bacterium]|nr:hypothetical protein [Gemmatimonadaceae bacterium]MCC6430283.1 hypothetical protein [Gemmatimonadaceae bacterium]
MALLVIGVAAAIGMAFAPELTRYFESGPSVKGPGYAEAAGVILLLWVGGLALVAVVAALLAWLAARHAGAGTGMLWSCWTPLPLIVVSAFRLWRRLSAS